MPKHLSTPGRFLARVATLLVLVHLGACAGSPYVDSRREAGKKIMVGSSNEEVVAICYKGGTPGPDVVKLAESVCAETGRKPVYASRARMTCNLLAPTKVFYKCVAPTSPAG
jgi:hypothetical protein